MKSNILVLAIFLWFPSGVAQEAPKNPAPRPDLQNRPIEAQGVNLLKLPSFYGVVKQVAALGSGEDLVSQVWFDRPDSYTLMYSAPTAFIDARAILDKTSLRMMYPKAKFAMVIKSLPSLGHPTAEVLLALPGKFRFDVAKSPDVLGMPATSVKFNETSGQSLVVNGEWVFATALSFPLKYEVVFTDASKYSQQFTRFEAGAKSPKKPNFYLPADVKTIQWDLDSRNFSAREASQELGFPLRLPPRINGLKLSKIIRQKGEAPIFAGYYFDEVRFLLVILQNQDLPPIGPPGWGKPARSALHEGELIATPFFPAFTFSTQGVRYFAYGNLSPLEMLWTADHFDKSDEEVAPKKKATSAGK